VGEPAVELEREDLTSSIGQRDRQRPESRADLQDAVTRPDTRVRDDRARQVRIDEEVLPEGLGRPDPVALCEGAQRRTAEAARLTR
jgi:hypothetical protein